MHGLVQLAVSHSHLLSEPRYAIQIAQHSKCLLLTSPPFLVSKTSLFLNQLQYQSLSVNQYFAGRTQLEPQQPPLPHTHIISGVFNESPLCQQSMPTLPGPYMDMHQGDEGIWRLTPHSLQKGQAELQSLHSKRMQELLRHQFPGGAWKR